MPLSFPAFRRDAAIWIASAVVTLCALGLAVVLVSRPPRLNADPGAEASISETASLGTVTPAPAGNSTAAISRATAFQARLAAFTPFEARLWRAFFPLPPASPRATVFAGRRVARGETPQACLAQAVYYEARGEPPEGQAAVAQVVLNRTRAPGRPSNVCGVVFEGASHPGCQFSFACDTRLGGHRVNAMAWRRAETVAADVLAGHEAPELRTAVNYHADYVRPGWAGRLQRTAEIGRHIFYAAAAPVSRAWAALSPAPAEPPHTATD